MRTLFVLEAAPIVYSIAVEGEVGAVNVVTWQVVTTTLNEIVGAND